MDLRLPVSSTMRKKSCLQAPCLWCSVTAAQTEMRLLKAVTQFCFIDELTLVCACCLCVVPKEMPLVAHVGSSSCASHRESVQAPKPGPRSGDQMEHWPVTLRSTGCMSPWPAELDLICADDTGTVPLAFLGLFSYLVTFITFESF